MNTVIYARVSTSAQDYERQLATTAPIKQNAQFYDWAFCLQSL